MNLDISLRRAVRGHFELTLFTPDSAHSVRLPIRKGHAACTLPITTPTAAELRLPQGGTLLFWAEASHITIDYDNDEPARSPIRGSRSNSEYRYLLETLSQQAEESEGSLATAAADYARQHPNSPYAALLLYTYVDDSDDLLAATARLAADSSYHYRLLMQKAQWAQASAVGSVLPDFEYTAPDGRVARTGADSLWARVLLFDASWHLASTSIADSLQHTIARSGTQAVLHTVAIDRHPHGWDAPYMQQLAVDRIPYIILVDQDGKIAARDVRTWNLAAQLRRLPTCGRTPAPSSTQPTPQR